MTEWRAIEGYPNYEINKEGIVMNISKGTILKPMPDCDGYLRVDLYNQGIKRHKKIHKLLANAFIPNPFDKPSVDHKDNNKLNNSLDNLRWATCQEQEQNKPSKGYLYCKNRTKPWRVRITNYEGHNIHIGYFPTQELAEIAVRDARIKYHGDFANL